jgi:hypothetical protein
MITILLRFTAIVAVLALPDGARAADVAETVRQWGLLGTWALDCGRPPARANTYETFVRRGGNVFLDRNGGDYKDSSRISSAAISPKGLLELRIEFTSLSQTRVNVLAKGTDGRKRIITNHDTKGSYTVKDGKFLSNDAQAPWLTRCK